MHTGEHVVAAHDEFQRELSIITPWLQMDGVSEPDREVPSDPERHRRISMQALCAMRAICPWLETVVRMAGAQILVSKGNFSIAMPAKPQDWIEVPELSAHLHLLPWAEDDEVAH